MVVLVKCDNSHSLFFDFDEHPSFVCAEAVLMIEGFCDFLTEKQMIEVGEWLRWLFVLLIAYCRVLVM